MDYTARSYQVMPQIDILQVKKKKRAIQDSASVRRQLRHWTVTAKVNANAKFEQVEVQQSLDSIMNTLMSNLILNIPARIADK